MLILSAAGVLYFWNLSRAPIYLGGDEARFGLNAQSIALTGRDLDGRFLPLYIRLDDLNWYYQPTLFYLIAVVLKVLPLGEGAIRVPTVLIGLLDVFLIAAVIRRLLPGRWYAPIAAVMLALTPAHFIFSRAARDFICLLPFVLGWLWCFLAFMDSNRAAVALLAGVLLGAGMYTHIAAWFFMPVYAGLTLIAAVFERKKLQLTAGFAAGFLLALLPLLFWMRSHPGFLQSIVGGYHVYDTNRMSPLQGVKDLLAYNSVQERLSVYWDYYNPAYLFFSGGSNLAIATRRAGVFPVAFAPLLVCGAYELWTRRRSSGALMLLAGLATAPLGATLVDDRYAIQRELVVVPFGVLVAVFGAVFLLQHRRGLARGAGVLLLASIPLQFGVFFHDYQTDYQVRSAFWFDPTDFRDVSEYMLTTAASRQLSAVYISNTLDDAIPRWRFYLAMHDRNDLWPRTHFFSKENLDVAAVPAGSLLVLDPRDPQLAGLIGAGHCCTIAHRVRHAGGDESAVILARGAAQE